MGVKDCAIKAYKNYVKGGYLLSDEIIKLKINRNWYAGTKTCDITSIYGNLIIRKHKNKDVIMNVFNTKTQNGFINNRLKSYLNEIWNIKNMERKIRRHKNTLI